MSTWKLILLFPCLVLKWIDKVVCFQQRRPENEDTGSEDINWDSKHVKSRLCLLSLSNNRTRCFFSRTGFIQAAPTETYAGRINMIHIPTVERFGQGSQTSQSDVHRSAGLRSFLLYWSAPDNNIAFPLHENCATIARLFLKQTKGSIDQFYHALKYEYFISLQGECARSLHFNHYLKEGVTGDGLPIVPGMTEAEKLDAMNDYYDIDWSEADYDQKGFIAYDLDCFLADRCVPWPGHWAAGPAFGFLVTDPLGPPAVGKTNLGERIQETLPGDGWKGVTTVALPGQGKFEIPDGNSTSNSPSGISARNTASPGVDKFWNLPVELRVRIMCRLSTLDEVYTLRDASRAFAVIPLAQSVYKAQLFGIPWLWDLDLGPSNRLALEWGAVFQDLHDQGEASDILVGVPALQNRRRIWQILEHIEHRMGTLPEMGPDPEAEMLLREYSRRMKLELLEKHRV